MDEVEQAALHSVSMKAVVNPPTDRCKNQQYQRISHLVAAGNARNCRDHHSTKICERHAGGCGIDRKWRKKSQS